MIEICKIMNPAPEVLCILINLLNCKSLWIKASANGYLLLVQNTVLCIIYKSENRLQEKICFYDLSSLSNYKQLSYEEDTNVCKLHETPTINSLND